MVIPVALLVGALIWRAYRAQATKKLCIAYNEKLLPPIRSPQNVIIAFDLHGVLFRHDYKKMFTVFWQSPDKWKLLWTTLHPSLWFDVLKLSRTCTVPEAFIMQLAKRNTAVKELLPTIIKILNAQKPHAQTVALLHKLKKEGYQLHVLSNIGETIYKDMEQQFPEILHMFENVLVTGAANGYISKPNPKMYHAYLATLNGEKRPLFIDDKIKNIRSALNCGIASVHYHSFDAALAMLKNLIAF